MIALDALYDGITTYRAGLVERDGSWVMEAGPEPDLASSLQPKADATTWVIELAERTFSDGTPIRAGDVKASWEHLARPGARSLGGTRLSIVQGYDAFVSGDAPELGGLRVIDDRTFEVALRHPYPDLPALLASPLLGVLPAHVVEEGLFVWERATSGAYTVEDEAGDGRSMRLARRSGIDSGPTAIEFTVFDDWGSAYEAFGRGELDWSPIPAAALGDEPADGGRRVVVPSGTTVWVALPVTAPFQDHVVRTALARLIDAARLRDAALPGSVELRSLVPAGVPGADRDACGRLCEPDPGGSLVALGERFPGGVPEVEVTVLDDPTQRALADEIVRAFGDRGVPVRVQAWSLDEYFDTVDQVGSMRLAGAIGLTPTQDEYLAAFLETDGSVAAMVDPAVGAELAAIRAEPDGAQRRHRYRQLERQLVAQALVLPLAQLQLAQQVSSRLEGWTPRLDGSVPLDQVRVAA